MTFKPNARGIRNAALQSPRVRAVVAAKAEAVAAAARNSLGSVDADDSVTVATAHAGQSRARSYVRLVGPDGARTEAKHRILGAALNAARGV